MFGYNFYYQTPKLSNQNSLFIEYDVLNGLFCNKSTKLIFESFMTWSINLFFSDTHFSNSCSVHLYSQMSTLLTAGRLQSICFRASIFLIHLYSKDIKHQWWLCVASWLDRRHLKYEHTKYIVFILTFSSAIIIIGVKHGNNCLLLTLTNNYIFHTMYLHGNNIADKSGSVRKH